MSAVMYPKATVIRSRKIRESAQGKPCTVRGPLCNRNTETTVWAHSPFRQRLGGGMGFKVSDLFGCYACSSCHDWLDGRMEFKGLCESKTVAYHRAQDLSLQQLIEQGILKVPA